MKLLKFNYCEVKIPINIVITGEPNSERREPYMDVAKKCAKSAKGVKLVALMRHDKEETSSVADKRGTE